MSQALRSAWNNPARIVAFHSLLRSIRWKQCRPGSALDAGGLIALIALQS
jgi:hypothetical protein